MNRRQHGFWVALIWGVAFFSTPFTVLALHGYAAGTPEGKALPSWLFSGGVVVLNALVFLSGMVCLKMHSDMKRFKDHHQPLRDELPPANLHEEIDYEKSVLKLLRMGDNSPLRGEMLVGSMVLSINGKPPYSAAEANRLLRRGANQIEWIDPHRKNQESSILVSKRDLMAHFELVDRPAVESESA